MSLKCEIGLQIHYIWMQWSFSSDGLGKTSIHESPPLIYIIKDYFHTASPSGMELLFPPYVTQVWFLPWWCEKQITCQNRSFWIPAFIWETSCGLDVSWSQFITIMCGQYFESILGETISDLGYFWPEVYTGLGQTIPQFIQGRV